MDTAVMEKADNVFVETGEFGWADIGTWETLYGTFSADENGNVPMRSNIISYNSAGNVVSLPKGKAVFLQDVNDLLVVDSDNVLLICRKGSEGDVRKFINDARMKLGEEYI
jgi:mannose-1-phosphate guanylyltransferase